MSDKPQISVIIPVYNVEAYLERCLNSILSQTFDDWECICIDDGSVDGSGKILDAYAKKDSRFVVIHQVNSGVSFARNVGLKRAKGNFITFVDSDDWIDSNTYEVAFRIAEDKNVDLVQWAFKKNNLKNFNLNEGFISLEKDWKYFTASMWCKLVRKTVIRSKNLTFPIGVRLSEDRLFSFQCYLNSKRAYYIPRAFYHYEIRGNSASHTITKEMLLEEFSVVKQMDDFVKNQVKDFSEFIYQQKVMSIFHSVLYTKTPEFKLARSMYPEINKKLIKQSRKFSYLFLLIYLHLDPIAYVMTWLWKKIRKPV